MKNVHVLSTEKPSRLVKIKDNLFYTTTKNIPGGVYQHIYITSDEEIKDGYYLDLTHNIIMKSVFYPSSDKNCKKIIIATDQDLIADGVQAIDDEFLEWFVKNPSCEEVEVQKFYGFAEDYLIIIPKEEICSFCDGTGQVVSCTTISRFKTCDCKIIPKEESKQESLKEAAENWNEKQTTLEFGKPHNAPNRIKAFIRGAKWQAERMYSEEEVLIILDKFLISMIKGEKTGLLEEWFEQFKKK